MGRGARLNDDRRRFERHGRRGVSRILCERRWQAFVALRHAGSTRSRGSSQAGDKRVDIDRLRG